MLNRGLLRNPISRPLLAATVLIPILSAISNIVISLFLVQGGMLDTVMAISASLILVSSLTIALAFNLIGGLVLGVCVNIGGTLIAGIVFALYYFDSSLVNLPAAVTIGIVRVMFIGLIAGMASSISVSPVVSQDNPHSFQQRFVGIIIGLLIGAGAVILALVLTLFLSQGHAATVILGESQNTIGDLAIGCSVSLVMGLGFSFTLKYREGQQRLRVLFSILFGGLIAISFILTGSVRSRLISDLALGAGTGFVLCVMYLLPFRLAQRWAGAGAGAWAGTLGATGFYVIILIVLDSVPLRYLLPWGGLSVLLGISFPRWWSMLLYPLMTVWNTVLYFLDKHDPTSAPALLRWHSAFWDERQILPLYGLETHLLWVATYKPDEAQKAMSFLITGSQRWAAQAAQIELDARRLESCDNVLALAQAHRTLGNADLAGPASALLRTFRYHSQDIEAALNQSTRYHQRLTLHESIRSLERLMRELQRSYVHYAPRFYPIVLHWHQLLTDYIDELTQIAQKQQELNNPYIVGVPLTNQQEIFVGRVTICRRIEQLILNERRPPLFLYGQRRMGKTSLLHNLGRTLPQQIIPLYIDGQGLVGSENYTDLLGNLVRQMRKSVTSYRELVLPDLPSFLLPENPFPVFNAWLDELEDHFQAQQAFGLLLFDEFEAFDAILQQEAFDNSIMLHTFRHITQHRPRLKLLLASSRPLEAFYHWASYLINAQVVHVSYLTPKDTYQLIESPIPGFSLHYEADASGEIWQLTHGHPHLVQLLCYEIVNLKNEQPLAERQLVRLADTAVAVKRALHSGSFFFIDVEQNQIDEAGRSLLRFLALQGRAGGSYEILSDRFPENVDLLLSELQRRELIEPVENKYRFQVELIRQWFSMDSQGNRAKYVNIF